jgi:hypothetical protein
MNQLNTYQIQIKKFLNEDFFSMIKGGQVDLLKSLLGGNNFDLPA